MHRRPGDDYASPGTSFHGSGEADPICGGAVGVSRRPFYGPPDLRAAYETGTFRITGYVTAATTRRCGRPPLALGTTDPDFPGEPRIYGVQVGRRS